MKNSIKTTVLLVVTLIFAMTFSSHSFAQKKGEKVYGFGYAYNVRTNTFYVSNIVSAWDESDIYLKPSTTDLGNQWHDKFKAEANNYYEYQINTAPGSFLGTTQGSYSKMDKDRNKIIGEYRQKGYTIYKIIDFRYHQDKYSQYK